MDLPSPPEDPDLKNIIDKLANFVARNGLEFENMTKQKQKDNLRFSFLFGGEYFNYYQYRVTTEQAIINQQKQKLNQQQALVQQAMQNQAGQLQTNAGGLGPMWKQPHGIGMAPTMPITTIPSIPVSIPPPGNVSLSGVQQMQEDLKQLEIQLEAQKNNAETQISQSEQNLSAQYRSFIQQQQVQIDKAIIKAEGEEIESMAKLVNISLEEFDAMVQPIIESCTKDAISNGKNWIFSKNMSDKHGNVIARYIAKRITAKSASFELRLHLIYLVNDVLHHCSRKNADNLQHSLEKVVTPIFCCAHDAADDSKKQKLIKLLQLWSCNKYFDSSVVEKLQDPPAAFSEYQASLITKHAGIVTQITQEVQGRYQNLQQQHQDFVNHLNAQVTTLQQQVQQLQQQLQQKQAAAAGPQTSAPAPTPLLPPSPNQAGPRPDFPGPPSVFGGPPPSIFGGPPHRPQQFDYGHGTLQPVVQDYNHGAPPAAPLPLPDFSKPPPGFPLLPPGPPPPGPPPPGFPPLPVNVLPTDSELTPSVPYYDLPAGLLAPLVKLEDFDYKHLDPKDIRLPPPMPPSDRLLAAVEAFYSAPTRDVPRDAEGWEKLALFEFLKAKDKARRIKTVERLKRGSRSKSRSRSRSRSKSRSRSRTPPIKRRKYNSRSRSRSPVENNDNSESSSQSSSRSPSPRRRSRSRSRSATPPSLMPMFSSTIETKLGEENKGHMLLKKMGWSGGGLGSSQQGIVEPIKAGDAREKMDMFKGVGVSVNDPFEQFRKNKSHGFIQRMRTRDDGTGPKKETKSSEKKSKRE